MTAAQGVNRLERLLWRLRWWLPLLIVVAASCVAAEFFWLQARGEIAQDVAIQLTLIVMLATFLAGVGIHWAIRVTHRHFSQAMAEVEQDRMAAEAQLRLRSRVSRISAQLQQAHHPEELAQSLLSALATHLDCRQGLCCLWDEAAAMLQAVARYAGPGGDASMVISHVPRLGTLVSECAARREPIVIKGSAATFLRQGSGLGEAEAAAVVLYPMQHGGRLFAVLELSTLKDWSDEDMLLLREIEPVFAMGLDILQRSMRSESLLQQTQLAEERNRLILDAVSEGIWGIDVEGRTTFVNRSALDLLGFSEADVLAQPMHSLAHYRREDGSDYPLAECPMYQTLSDGVQRRVDSEVLWHKTGYAVPVEYVSTAICQGTAVVGAVIVLRDTTQQRSESAALARASQDAQNAMQMKGLVLANMSREVRSAMNAVVGMTHVLLKSELTSQQRTTVKRVQASGRHLLGIVNDMVDFARLEDGTLRIESEVFSLKGLLKWLGDSMRDRIELKGLGWSTEVEPQVPDMLSGDRQHLAQVLSNYCDNAIKFTDKGEVTVVVRRDSSENSALRLRFEVRDSGMGLTPAQRDRLFEPLLQSSETTREDGSVGLGLFMARTLVEMMGGSLGVESTPGAGSTFWFALDIPQVVSQTSEIQELAALPVAFHGLRVLVVDDDPIDQQVASELLGDAGIQVEHADNGQQALEKLEQQTFDLVFMDIRMPVLDGLAATTAMRKRSAMSHIPVVAMTANVMPDDLAHCRTAGMNDWLAKPLEPEALLQMVAKWVKRQPVSAA